MSKELDAFSSLADTGIYYTISRLKRKLKNNFVAFLVHGGYIIGDYKIGSDVDCLAIVKKNNLNGTNINHWVLQLESPLFAYLKKKQGSKILKEKIPEININTITEIDFKKNLSESNPLLLDTILFGKMFYPPEADPKKYFKIKTISNERYISATFNNEISHFLRSMRDNSENAF
jgi:predicted nucleotidyltransferase